MLELLKTTILGRFTADGYYEQVYKYLENFDNSGLYPGITDWFLNKVKPNIGKNRIVYVVFDPNPYDASNQNQIVGLAINKYDGDKQVNKLCHVSVHPQYQGCGIGLSLFETAIHSLYYRQWNPTAYNGYKVFCTFGEELWETEGRILTYFGIKPGELCKKQYRTGNKEYFSLIPDPRIKR